jgi:hypothetical protein
MREDSTYRAVLGAEDVEEKGLNTDSFERLLYEAAQGVLSEGYESTEGELMDTEYGFGASNLEDYGLEVLDREEGLVLEFTGSDNTHIPHNVREGIENTVEEIIFENKENVILDKKTEYSLKLN